MNQDLFIQNLFNALTVGSLYALIAIGYTMVYGILRFINFAHGDVFMVGAYFIFFTVNFSIIPWPLAALAAIIGASALGILVDRVAYRPLREAPRISALISAIGVSFLLENLGLVIFTGLPRPAVQPAWLVDPIIYGNIRILPLSFVVPAVTAVLVLGLLFIVYRTRPGLAMRSIARDIETTRLMGVSIDRTIALTFGLGSALAAAAGIMWAMRYPQIHPFMGVLPGFKAFIAAVVGGIGSIQGAVLGGLLLGTVEIVAVANWPELSGYRDAFAFVLLIVILLFRPTGLMGEKMEDKI
ncbi:MAG: branched-chain amino acid ABC transporter permease [Candidatus Adiutrix sp.]|jgi:branched-chain amino acid transport system permease protein|nr:branched-chain amino acid ABC transporter permease [Candidatus Adiutrix sp.]